MPHLTGPRETLGRSESRIEPQPSTVDLDRQAEHPRSAAIATRVSPGSRLVDLAGPACWLRSSRRRSSPSSSSAQGFVFLRDSERAQAASSPLVAIVWGVGGVALLYLVANWLVERLPDDAGAAASSRSSSSARPSPSWSGILALPTVRTFWLSLFRPRRHGLRRPAATTSRSSPSRSCSTAFRNNLMWIVFGSRLQRRLRPARSPCWPTAAGSRRVAKSIIFMPMAISLVGAGVIWNFIYAVQGPERRRRSAC